MKSATIGVWAGGRSACLLTADFPLVLLTNIELSACSIHFSESSFHHLSRDGFCVNIESCLIIFLSYVNTSLDHFIPLSLDLSINPLRT